jgi:hypothetical protein
VWGRGLGVEMLVIEREDVDRKDMTIARGGMLVRERGSKVRMYRSRVLNQKRRASDGLQSSCEDRINSYKAY